MDYSKDWDTIDLPEPRIPSLRRSYVGVFHQLVQHDDSKMFSGVRWGSITRQATWQATVGASTTPDSHTDPVLGGRVLAYGYSYLVDWTLKNADYFVNRIFAWHKPERNLAEL